MRVALDLFAGTGGATAAFRNYGWIVYGVDNDARHARYRLPGRYIGDPCRINVIADVRRLPFAGRVDFLWASPPCNAFSTMPPGRDDRRPSLELVFATLSAVRDLRPRFWIMENVVGALPFLGLPRQKIGPFCLWGYFPRIKAPLEVVEYRKMERRNAVERAAIPYALSLAVLDAVERAWNKRSIADLRSYRRHRYLAKINRTGPAWRPTSSGHAADCRSTATRPKRARGADYSLPLDSLKARAPDGASDRDVTRSPAVDHREKGHRAASGPAKRLKAPGRART